MDLKERLEAVLEYSKMSTRALAIKCGLSQPTLDRQIKGVRSVSIETMIAICTQYPEISREWILMGEGGMLKTDTPNANIPDISTPDINMKRILKLVDTIAMLQDTIATKNETITILQDRLDQLEK